MGFAGNTNFQVARDSGGGFEVRVAREKPRDWLASSVEYHSVRCYACKETIEPGEQYLKDTEPDHGYRHTYCLPCGREIQKRRIEAEKQEMPQEA